jgi:putative peptidoglycan lipid II flippase
VGPHADVWQTALRAPNLIQNLLGEQTLSAAFIPIYVRLLSTGQKEEAKAFAGAILGLLLLVAGGLAFLGVLLARPLVAIFAAGYLGDAARVASGVLAVDRYELTVGAVRWMFPMTGLLVLAAWALGVLNSHRQFLLPYLSPVAWNAAILAGAAWGVWRGSPETPRSELLSSWLEATCIGALFGGVLQLAVQLPSVFRLLGGLPLRFHWRTDPVREALRALPPALAGRGVVQLSSYLDQLLASLLAAGAVSALGYAQTLYLLPLALFGSAMAAASLPELAAQSHGPNVASLARFTGDAVDRALRWQIPASVVLSVLALPVVEGVFRLLPGAFGRAEGVLVAGVLALYAVGLPASTGSRVVQSAFYALGDPKTPARVAGLRVGISAGVGFVLMGILDRIELGTIPGIAGLEGSSLRWGAAGLAFGATVGAWYERHRLFQELDRRFGGREWRSARGSRWRFWVALLLTVPAWAAVLVLAGLELPPPVQAAAGVGLVGVPYGLWEVRRRRDPDSEAR